MTGNLWPAKVAGREQKRLLNRARDCALCPEPLGADRKLFRTFDTDLVVAHPACAEEHAERKRAELLAANDRQLAAMDRAQARLNLAAAGLWLP